MSQAAASSKVRSIDGMDLRGTRMELERALHAPGAIYSDPEIFSLEKEKIFMKDWNFIGREEELAQPGDFMTMRIMGEPLAVTRDSDGKLHAFLNMCAHRGAEVVQGSGNAKLFSCPYHAWVYDLGGQLKRAYLMDGSERLDMTSCRLPPLKLATWRGNIFVNFSSDPTPFETAIADVEESLGFLQPDKCRLSSKVVVELDCNWKLMVENTMDMYHVNTLHNGTFGKHTSADGALVKLRPGGHFFFEYSSAPTTPEGKSLFGQLPWLNGQPESFACMGFLPPNFQIIARSDQVRVLITTPISPERCRITVYGLFPKEHFADPEFERKARVYHDYLQTILLEDETMVASLQKAMASKRFRPGPMSRLEQPIHHVLNNYLDKMFGTA